MKSEYRFARGEISQGKLDRVWYNEYRNLQNGALKIMGSTWNSGKYIFPTLFIQEPIHAPALGVLFLHHFTFLFKKILGRCEFLAARPVITSYQSALP